MHTVACMCITQLYIHIVRSQHASGCVRACVRGSCVRAWFMRACVYVCGHECARGECTRERERECAYYDVTCIHVEFVDVMHECEYIIL